MIVSRIERGLGGGVTFDAWQRVALAAGRPLLVALQRSVDEQPADAAHLAIQELVLRSARRAGFRGSFELSTRPAEPWRSADVGLRDDRRRLLVLVECWNTFGDIGAAARSTDRKRAEGEALARSTWGDGDVRVRSVWFVRDVARNRTLVARYPEVFASRFPGSSLGWTRALTQGMDPPADPGLVWCDARATRLFARRQRPTGPEPVTVSEPDAPMTPTRHRVAIPPCYTPGLTAKTERSRPGTATERARDGASRAGTTGPKVAREPLTGDAR